MSTVNFGEKGAIRQDQPAASATVDFACSTTSAASIKAVASSANTNDNSSTNANANNNSSTSSTTSTIMSKRELLAKPESFQVTLQLEQRELQVADFDKEFLPLLDQLSDVGHIDKTFFREHLQKLHADELQLMLVVEDLALKRICASGTVVVEPKFIHSAGFVGHLEDLVVDSGLRGKGIGRRVTDQLKAFARSKGCYKIILDCAEANVPFYEKCGFKRKGACLSSYFRELTDDTKARFSEAWLVASGQLSGEALRHNNDGRRGVNEVIMAKETAPSLVDGMVIRQLEAGDFDK